MAGIIKIYQHNEAALIAMDSYMEHDDFKLMELLRQGNQAAFTALFNRYDRLLFIYAYKKLQDKEEAKDVVQDVFINLWNGRNDFKLQSNLSGYLYKSVSNKALNLFRDKNINEKYLLSLQELLDKNDIATDHRIREKDIASLIDREIGELPPKMREVFELRRKEYLSNKEIADKLNISEQTVATHIKRALKILRTRLGLVIYLFFLIR